MVYMSWPDLYYLYLPQEEEEEVVFFVMAINETDVRNVYFTLQYLV
jgi:hypothetical protein